MQGATIPVLYKNIPRVADGRVISVNTHMPTYNPQQPMALMNGPVTDITVQVGNETIPFAGLPASGVVANFPEKGLFLATDRTAILREVEATRTTLKQDLDQVPAKQKMYADYEKLSLELNPALQKEAAQAQELASLRGEVAELKELLRASLEQNKKEE